VNIVDKVNVDWIDLYFLTVNKIILTKFILSSQYDRRVSFLFIEHHYIQNLPQPFSNRWSKGHRQVVIKGIVSRIERHSN
jgi:hypothetical protein